MIEKIEQIAVTETSHPFATAYEKCRFAEKGYIEEEYFISGKANVYGWDNGEKTVTEGFIKNKLSKLYSPQTNSLQ